jgi:C4-dicarboxylate-binding protein DctP
MASPLKVKFVGYQSEPSVHTKAAKVFGESLARQLGDAVTFELQENVTIEGRKAAEILTLVEEGDRTVCYFASSYLADRFPEIAVLDLPFTVTERAKAYEKLDGELGQLLKDRVAENSGYRLLGFWDNGFRHLSNRVRAIHGPADCQGLVIRTGDSALHQETFRRMGFEPVYLDVRDLPVAVASGEVDAQDNSLTNIFNFDLRKHHPYITLSGHFLGICPLLCHSESYFSWTDAEREAVDIAADEATIAQRAFAIAEEEAVRVKLIEAGNDVAVWTDDERAVFQEIVRPVIEEQHSQLGSDLVELLLG